MSSQCALFYNDILDCNMYDSFENLISVFSELKDSAISFQISPVNLNFQEKLAIGEMVSLYHNIAEGNFTKEKRLKDNLLELPLRCVDSYYSVLQDGLLEYNILIFGTRQNANRLANRIVGMLKENENKLASFEIMDISKLKIKLYSEIYTYPWNTRTYINLMLNKLPFNNNSEILIRKLGRMMSEGEALNFFRLPIHSGNTLALNSMDAFYVSEQINTALLRKDNIKFGMVNTVNDMIEIGCPKEQFSKHALIVGMPGTGKTTFSLNLLLQFYRKRKTDVPKRIEFFFRQNRKIKRKQIISASFIFLFGRFFLYYIKSLFADMQIAHCWDLGYTAIFCCIIYDVQKMIFIASIIFIYFFYPIIIL